jgi:hypothetical protein
MNFYSASVALLWVTALRAGGAPTLSGRSALRSGKSSRREGAERISGTPVAPAGDSLADRSVTIRPPVRT